MNGHKLPGHTWSAVLALVVLVAAHAALFGWAFRGHWAVVLVAGLLGVLAAKYAWWRFR